MTGRARKRVSRSALASTKWDSSATVLAPSLRVSFLTVDSSGTLLVDRDQTEAAQMASEVLQLAARAVEGELEDVFDAHTAGSRLTAACRRLQLLPVPAGEHPYLDGIVPTLEAMEVLLLAV